MDPSRVRVVGPLAAYRVGFGRELSGQGYTPGSASLQLLLMAHVRCWLVARGLTAGDFTPVRVGEFLEARRVGGYTSRISLRGLTPLLGYLRGLGAIPLPAEPVGGTPGQLLLAAFRDYLQCERGLAAGTVCRYLAVARLFLAECERPDGLDLQRLTAGDVTSFVVCQCRGPRVASATVLVTGLRSLLRFLLAEGYTDRPLAQVVPTATVWAEGSLPRALRPEVIAAMRAGCDEHTVVGVRDLAILTVLHRLGLRAGEVAGLGLADVDWRHGEIVVRGKGNRQERLPLPADVGEAMVAYLRHRPRGGVPGPVLEGARPNRRGVPRRGRPTGACRLPARRASGGGPASAAAQRGHGHAGRRRFAGRSRSAAAAAFGDRDGYLRKGRPDSAANTRPAVARGCGMSDLHQAVEDYLTVRRALGAKLERHPWLLNDFVAYLQAAGATTVTAELALAWAWLPGPDTHPTYVSNRLSVVRGFARHLQAFDPATEVPPARLVPRSRCRATPYLYSDAEVAALMTAARSLTPALRAATYETLIALLMVTGARVGELIRLDRDDVDWDDSVLVIWDSKFAKSRELALHPSTVDALRRYAALRDRSGRSSTTASFFVSAAGTRLVYRTVQQTFSSLLRRAGLTPRSDRCRPRIHDARHSFAVRTVLGWYRDGVDVQARLPWLSTYLGHRKPTKGSQTVFA
jgi:integrase/recombinase XerD